MKNWRTVVKIVVAVLSALLGAAGATAAPFFVLADNVSYFGSVARFWQMMWQKLKFKIKI